jgi:hypothetical protein
MLVIGCRTNSERSLDDEFFQLGTQEQRQVVSHYPLEKQIDIYLASRHHIYPYVPYLAEVIAENGESIIPLLVDRLNQSTIDEEKVDLLWVFFFLEMQRDYAVADDGNLMDLLERQVRSIHSEIYRESAMDSLQRIRRQGQKRRAAEGPGPG